MQGPDSPFVLGRAEHFRMPPSLPPSQDVGGSTTRYRLLATSVRTSRRTLAAGPPAYLAQAPNMPLSTSDCTKFSLRVSGKFQSSCLNKTPKVVPKNVWGEVKGKNQHRPNSPATILKKQSCSIFWGGPSGSPAS